MDTAGEAKDVSVERPEDGFPDSCSLIADMILRAKNLRCELGAFQNRLCTFLLRSTAEIKQFRNTVDGEVLMLEKLFARPESESTVHTARSSNLAFLEQVWSFSKSSKDVVALQKRMYLDNSLDTSALPLHRLSIGKDFEIPKGSKPNTIVIDAITDGGRTWNKVSLVTNNRLLFDLAKQGWECDDSDRDDEYGSGTTDEAAEDRDVPLLKTTKQLMRASRLFRVRTKQPTVQLVLPRIQPDGCPEVAHVLDEIRACGAVVLGSKDLNPPPILDKALQTMARDPVLELSEKLNIDCTILLAVVSDFSHTKVTEEPWFHTALKRQVLVEGDEQLLPTLLYPVFATRPLSCTTEAAERMREIVGTIGTVSEKARTAILFGDGISKSHTELIEGMQRLSIYHVPSDFQLPVQIVDQDENGCQSSLPDAAETVSIGMSSVNKSVFLYGWASGRTTITSNRAAVKKIEHDLEKFEDVDSYPKIWVCPTARSLLGKEKHKESQVRSSEVEKKARVKRKGRRGKKREDALFREH